MHTGSCEGRFHLSRGVLRKKMKSVHSDLGNEFIKLCGCITVMQDFQRVEDGVESPGAGGHKLPWCWELQEHPMLLTPQAISPAPQVLV